MRLSNIILIAFILLFVVQNSHGMKSKTKLFKMCKKLPKKLKKICFRRVKLKIKKMRSKKKKVLKNNTCSVCVKGNNPCCSIGMQGTFGGSYSFKVECRRNCRHPECIECFKKSFEKTPKKNKINELESNLNLPQNVDSDLDEIPMPIMEPIQGLRNVSSNKHSYHKMNKLKCLEEKCDVCRNHSCCNYNDKGNQLLSFECDRCRQNEVKHCMGCYNCFTKISFKKKMFRKTGTFSPSLNADKQLKLYFENRKTNKNLENFLMRRADKYRKKINRNMLLKRKKNWKIVQQLRKAERKKSKTIN